LNFSQNWRLKNKGGLLERRKEEWREEREKEMERKESTVQYSTVQYSTVQYSTVQYSTVQYSTVQRSTLEVLSGEVEHGYDVSVSCCFSEVTRCSSTIDDNVRHILRHIIL
jgi:hypothetical protein